MLVSADLNQNIAQMKKLFDRDKTMITRRVTPPGWPEGAICLFFCDGMVNATSINENIIRPLTLMAPPAKGVDRLRYLEESVVQTNEARQSDDWNDLVYSMVYGDTILFCSGCEKALVLNTKGFAMRGIQEPDGETVLKGPREGFTEGILRNLSMLRRKLRVSELKQEYLTLGTVSKTVCALCYIDGVVDQKVLAEVRSRLKTVDMDGVFDSNYVAEMIRDHKKSPFKTIGTTERPDVVAAKLLEGRVALFVDGTPVVLTMPGILIESFQSSEDYYVGFQFAAISRILRMAGFFLAISVVPIYIALMTFHAEMLPTPLLLSIASARQGVPFPSVLEALGLLTAFDLLREAGTRTPSAIGQTLSIVGGLVVGSAAVEARFASAPMVIIIAFSGITGLMIPKLKSAVIIIRLGLIALVSCAGLYGYLIGMAALLAHLASMQSFGVNMLASSPLAELGNHEDSLMRVPFARMKKSGRFLSRRERT